MNTERVQEIEKDIRNWFDDKNAEDSFAFIAFNELVVAVKESQAEIIEYHKRIARAVTDEAKFRELNPLLDETTDVLLSRIFSLQLRMTPWQIWGEKEIISLHKQLEATQNELDRAKVEHCTCGGETNDCVVDSEVMMRREKTKTGDFVRLYWVLTPEQLKLELPELIDDRAVIDAYVIHTPQGEGDTWQFKNSLTGEIFCQNPYAKNFSGWEILN